MATRCRPTSATECCLRAMTAALDLASLFARHKKAVLAFSGGKDSLVCLHLCREFRDQLDVCWVNTGAMFPHMAEFIRKAVKGFNFVELKSDQGAWIKQLGLPVDLVPVSNSIWRVAPNSDNPNPPKTMLQPWTSCCAKVRFAPLLEYLAQSGATLFIHGQRYSDGGGFPVTSGPDAKVEICRPVWDWSSTDVFRYIVNHGIELPEQYNANPPARRSLECWSCTALLDETDRLNYTRAHHPDLWEKLRPRLLAVYQATREAANGTTQVLGGVLRVEEEARAALVANLQAELQSNGEETLDAREVKATEGSAAPQQEDGDSESVTRP